MYDIHTSAIVFEFRILKICKSNCSAITSGACPKINDFVFGKNQIIFMSIKKAGVFTIVNQQQNGIW